MLNNFYRVFAGLMGGMLGTIFIAAIYGISIFLLGNQETPITNFVLIFMIFLGSLIANLSSGALFTLADPNKYDNKQSMLWHAFLLNLFLFFVAFPFFILLKDISLVAVLQLAFSALASNIVYELFAARGAYILTGIYGTLFGSFLLLTVLSLLEKDSTITTVLLFSILPVMWVLLTSLTIFVESMYTIIYKNFGIAILDPKTKI